MRRILADVVAFGKQYLRSKVGTFFVFVFPILLILLFGAIFQEDSGSTVDLPVQDLDESTLSRGLLRALNNTTAVRVSMIQTDTSLQEYVRDNSLSIALQIPRGFEDDVIASLGSNGSARVNVTLYGDASQSTFGIAVGVLGAVADQMSFALAGAMPVIGVSTEPVASPSFQPIDFFLPGIVGMTVMTNALFSMTAVCAEYRQRRYFKLLATTTLSKPEWLASKILWFALILIASLFASVAVGVFVFNVQPTIDALVIGFIVAGAFLFTSMGMFLGTFVKDPEAGAALSNAIGFPMMFISGSFFPIEAMPPFLQTAAWGFPLTYLNLGLRDAMIFGNVSDALVNLAIVVAVGSVFFVIGARAMSWKGR